MRLEGIARRYAVALADTVPASEAAAVQEELRSVADLMATEPLEAVWHHPGISPSAKIAVVGELGLSQKVRELLTVLVNHRRERLLSVVVDEFARELMRRSGKMAAEVRTARPVDRAWQGRIVAALSARVGHEVVATFVEDPSLLGGIEVRFQDELMDGSVQGRLRRLGRVLRQEVSVSEA
jgi:F-type H+-transporting ATPase subunit delta